MATPAYGIKKVQAEVTGPMTAFDSVSVAELTPIAQVTAPYGLLEQVETFAINGATTTANNSLFEVSSGPNSDALGSILTRRQITYGAGQGLKARFTALFGTPQPDSQMDAGLIINTDRLGFGYDGVDFGIAYHHNGASDIWELTVTVPASGAENATITISGVPLIVPLTAGTVQHNAFEIANSLNAQSSFYDFSSNDDQVVARSLLSFEGGVFLFSSATAVGGWSNVEVGKPAINDFIPQTEWNIDKRPSLDPSKGNVYQVQMQFLGFGGIEFYIEDSESSNLVLVHRIKYANKNTLTSVGNPTFRVGWLAINGPSNTTPIEIKGGSAAGFVEGRARRTEAPRAIDNSVVSSVTNQLVNVLTIRNRIVFSKRRNRVETFGLFLDAATDSNKPVIVEILKNASITGDLNYQYIDKDNSVIETAFESGQVLSGRLIGSLSIAPSGSQFLDLGELLSLILPGETLSVAATITSGAPSGITASLIWQEDI
jgi:hypothetical protein